MHTNTTPSLLDLTLAAAVRDRQTTVADGSRVDRLVEGVRIKPLTTHADARGSVTELYDPRWDWHDDALVFAYAFSIRPGIVKGWNLHRDHEDRYVVLQGEMELVLFDPRPESPTCGSVCRIVLSELHRCIRQRSAQRVACRPQHRVERCDRRELPDQAVRSCQPGQVPPAGRHGSDPVLVRRRQGW